MRQRSTQYAIAVPAPAWPAAWRLILIALCVLILSSCRGSGGCFSSLFGKADNGEGKACVGPASRETLPPEAYTGGPNSAMPACPPCAYGCPPCADGCQWAPPGIRRPWPPDEYICDGGDAGVPAMISGRGELGGVEMQDTVATYDTLDGHRLIEPSNQVCIYAPRFGAVRQVVGLVATEERQQLGGVYLPVQAGIPTTYQPVGSAKQNIQPNDQIGARPAVAMRTRQGDGAMSTAVGPRAFQDDFKPYENLSIIRLGQFDEAEMAFLAQGSNAAIAWTNNQAVQIILDRKGAMATVKYDPAASVYTAEMEGCGRLRLCKIASTAFGQAGRGGGLHPPLRQLRRSAHRQRGDRRQPEHAAGVRARQRRVQPGREILHPAERRRLPGGPLRAGQSAGALQGRHPPLPLPRAVTYMAPRVCGLFFLPRWLEVGHMRDLLIAQYLHHPIANIGVGQSKRTDYGPALQQQEVQDASVELSFNHGPTAAITVTPSGGLPTSCC